MTSLLGDPAVAQGRDAHHRESAVRERVARLEALFGDPSDPANPVGYTALLEADRAAVPFAAGEALLDDFRITDEYVPRALGGRLDGMDTLVRIMRPVLRRDVGLAMGHGMTTFMAASDVWAAGSSRQRHRLAALLRGGGKAAIAQHETAHSNDYVRSQVTARRGPRGYLISGGKPMVNNLERAGALVLFCRTDPAPGSRSHSVLLLDPEQLTDARTAVAARRTHVGLRGCRWAGVEFDDCPVPESALLGPEGSGIETALRSFQISRTVISATAVAALDTSLRTAVRFDRENSGGWQGRGIDGRTGAALTNAFVNLLLYDSLAVVATRALHLLPAETSVYSAALKYLLPRVLTETMYDLSIVLGSGFYTREGTLGIFQKHVRDVPVLSLGHAGTVACQATVIPQMPRLARSSWFIEDEAPAGLFRLRGDLPPLRTDRLSLACGRDSLTASMLVVAAGVEGSGPVERALRTLAGQLVEELRDVRRRVLRLEAAGSASTAQPARFALMDRYALLLAAAAVLGLWDQARYGPDPFLADPCWAAAALHRIARRLGTRVADLPPECETRIRHEVQLRFSTQISYDLYSTPIPG
ncbi:MULTISPECIES: acyl-CoA dehydrogenase [unclassified Streptomyces]|uniref:acyl-CoA dehydrogenase n=1 Tax=unclassified Streptomyces TaxID=2593676 RepID=UPI002E3617A5|nr:MULTISPECIES: acyl-CoA dehydrogenase [unclassified Streptomyces]WUC64011.1 acyl-CoA dehydrogenase [Streptomyces sp. NBC_00539]